MVANFRRRVYDLKRCKALPIFEQVYVRRTQEYLAYCKDDELKIAEKARFRRFVLFQYSIPPFSILCQAVFGIIGRFWSKLNIEGDAFGE